jgi:transcriptional regulator with XRE-family HTH domain
MSPNPFHPLTIYRKRRGWRMVDLAKSLDVSLSTVWRWESGKTEPSLMEARRIVEHCGGEVTAHDLLFWGHHAPRPKATEPA